MKRKHFYIILFACSLFLAAVFSLWSLYRYPGTKLIQTTRLIEKSLPNATDFYTDRFIYRLRQAMYTVAARSSPSDSLLQAQIQKAEPDKIFIAGLSHIMQRKAGWPVVKDNEANETEITFTIKAPQNFTISLSCITGKGHLVFNEATNLEQVFALETHDWERIVSQGTNNAR